MCNRLSPMNVDGSVMNSEGDKQNTICFPIIEQNGSTAAVQEPDALQSEQAREPESEGGGKQDSISSGLKTPEEQVTETSQVNLLRGDKCMSSCDQRDGTLWRESLANPKDDPDLNEVVVENSDHHNHLDMDYMMEDCSLQVPRSEQYIPNKACS
ncbi:hypothetical protein GUITHDRAFT_109351 [Guillardia theta CCMP2712]|uniref:Uncharacterized protein n=1 Tax=Guillardia theta (strain CCMP2712) TaxID=905079 RepID=L1J924_GUITC|nr:hypothetical protein GUITHDRAFT_109351 [Guillardia theta CCMP2712]EKX44575.1 hypothetical protein GUITHDRAFT_109351 [Guillardia theta CCMP2712]|eukprot:XP_005831555.1 hypothetical protein GUITHDRAFT_109351 [Guillardia theta CCMP2712]